MISTSLQATFRRIDEHLCLTETKSTSHTAVY